MSRPSQCGSCGECLKCERAAYMREWYRRPGNAQAGRMMPEPHAADASVNE